MDCTKVEVRFEGTFRCPSAGLTLGDLKRACPRYTDQLSIQEVDPTCLAADLRPVWKASLAQDNEFGADFEWKVASKSTRERAHFEVDSDAADRATSSHAELQNKFARWLNGFGIRPLQLRADEPPYDLGWSMQGKTFVCEVKSLTPVSEEKQLRYGVGQLLRYRSRLRASGVIPRIVMMVEREPADRTWINLCEEEGIVLLWPDELPQNGISKLSRT